MTVYPRVGGGNGALLCALGLFAGLSPRGRGKLGRGEGGGRIRGSIPAWAGETNTQATEEFLQKVYPRVGGGNNTDHVAHIREGGLSPRGRGKRGSQHQAHAHLRSIPAWAGETVDSPKSYSAARVYPRVGGGNNTDHVAHIREGGLSPRGRGKRLDASTLYLLYRSIPAWAGETMADTVLPQELPVYPRVGGGNRARPAGRIARRGLSPRGRGKHRPAPRFAATQGSIPAWAGETRRG